MTNSGGPPARYYFIKSAGETAHQTYLRENAPQLQLLEPLVNFEEPRLAYQATLDMLERTRDLVGIYMVGGGVEGVMDALRESAVAQHVTTICHDLTDDTRSGLIDGVLDFVIHQPRELMASATVAALFEAVKAVRAGDDAGRSGSPISSIVPFELYSVENI